MVLISIAYDKTAQLRSTYVTRPEGRKALNVAIFRVKEKMIVFKSIASSEIKSSLTNDSINTFKLWLLYLELSKNDRKYNFINKIEENNKDSLYDSSLKTEVYDYISKK